MPGSHMALIRRVVFLVAPTDVCAGSGLPLFPFIFYWRRLTAACIKSSQHIFPSVSESVPTEELYSSFQSLTLRKGPGHMQPQ